MAAILFSIGVVVLAAGVVWFHIVRPILESYGVITVNPSQDTAPIVMSRSTLDARPSAPSSVQTRPDETPDQTNDAAARRVKLLDTYKPLRKLGMSREDARVFLTRWNIPLDNNLWAAAAPPADPHITPVAGRPTDADFPYQHIDA